MLFIVQAGWIAWSSLYPMAFDENFHFDVIKLYAGKTLPFWSNAPAHADYLGGINRDPSYLYHYILSLLYRPLHHIATTEYAQIISFRVVSILLFALGLVIYRSVLLHISKSRAMTHVALACFVLTPLAPFLGSQINYDNLLFPLSGTFFLVTIRIMQRLKKDGGVTLKSIIAVSLLTMTCSLVKYTFLPIAITTLVWLVVLVFRAHRSHQTELRAQMLTDLKALKSPTRIVLLIITMLAIGLFAERYAVNVIKYHSPVPSCPAVLSQERCMAFPPYLRDKQSHQALLEGTLKARNPNALHYTFVSWLPHMFGQLFYTYSGPGNNYKVGKSFVLPLYSATALALGALLLLYKYHTKFQHSTIILYMLSTAVVFTALLWLKQYKAYVHNGWPVAVQVRYFVNYLPILYLLVVMLYGYALKQMRAKVLLAYLFMSILLLQGGGTTVFIIRSNPSWYWPRQHVLDANQAAQKVLSPLMIGR